VGRGLEFAEVRPFQPGDDVRSIDWRHTARRGRPFTKVFHREREQAVLLCIDQGPSMHFGTRVAFKSVQAARAAALLAWSAIAAGDRVGGVVCAATTFPAVPVAAREAGAMTLFRQLCAATEEAFGSQENAVSSGGLAHTLSTVSRMARHGGDAFLVSDFSTLDEATERAIARLAVQCRLGLVHVFDPIEKAPPPPGIYRVTAGRDERTLDVRDEAARVAWGEAFRQRSDRLIRLAHRLVVPLVPLSTQDDPLRALVVMKGNRLRGAAAF
jgi:uncharacterized protein (DUF58 family)